jgi:hypothetical protein
MDSTSERAGICLLATILAAWVAHPKLKRLAVQATRVTAFSNFSSGEAD